MKRLLPAFFLSLITFTLSATELRVRLLSDMRVTAAMVSIAAGKYRVVADGKDIPLKSETSVFQLNINGDSLDIRMPGDTVVGRFKTFTIEPLETACLFKLKPVVPNSGTRTYHDALTVSVKDKIFCCMSRVELEDYVGGVVESESGGRTTPEYYKVQAILCRTYALSHMDRHTADGYELCDGVHCQVYKSRTIEPEILNAVNFTKGQVLVDGNLNLIIAAFHSNCGGQTVNSEDIWASPVSYLRSVKDTFCTRMPHARWTRTLSTEDWMSYLDVKCKYNVKDSTCKWQAEHLTQGARLKNLPGGKLAMGTVRLDWQLRSTFFNIEPIAGKDSLLFSGRGYGHGVGLCQEGAIRMAKLGYPYTKILSFYYKGVSIVNMNKLDFFREDDDDDATSNATSQGTN